jgi:hypothetical protein
MGAVSRPQHTTRADVEQALVGAEALLRGTRRRRRTLSTVTLILLVIAAVGVAAAVTLVRGSREALPWLAVIIAAASLASVATGLVVIARLRRWVGGQERHMIKMVDWVREVFPLVAKRDEWSAADKESVRQRVAQFPVVAR